MLTRNDLEQAARATYAEAHAADPHGTEERTVAVLQREVFVWSLLTVPQLRALRRALLPTVLAARG